MTEYPNEVYAILELAEQSTMEEGVPPEHQAGLKVCTNAVLIGRARVYDPEEPIRTRQIKAHKLRPRGVFQNRSDDRDGYKVAGVTVQTNIVEVFGSGPPCTWPYDANVTVFDGPPPGPRTWKYRLTLSTAGETALALRRMETIHGGEISNESKVEEADVPPEFREGNKLDGDVLTVPRIVHNPQWPFQNRAQLTRAWNADKLTRRIKVGRAYAYAYQDLAALWREDSLRGD